MITVTLYYQDACAQCDEIVKDLDAFQSIAPHHLVRIDIAQDPALVERWGEHLPVVEIGPYRLQSPFTRQDLQVMLSAANDRSGQLEKVDQAGYQKSLAQGHSLSGADRLSYWLSHHYLLLINFFLFIYAGLPWLAPVLMKANLEGPANLIYKVYSPMCHQLAFRSFFLFGPQAFYPRSLSGIQGVVTYEQLQHEDTIDLFAARAYEGGPGVGFKVALCERDIAIYGAMLLFGLIYALSGRRLRPISWYVWLFIGLVPIGLDGFSQLPSFATGLPAWVPMRESTPYLRTFTGALFGWMTAWYLFPMIEDSMRETRRMMQRKMAVVQQLKTANPVK